MRWNEVPFHPYLTVIINYQGTAFFLHCTYMYLIVHICTLLYTLFTLVHTYQYPSCQLCMIKDKSHSKKSLIFVLIHKSLHYSKGSLWRHYVTYLMTSLWAKWFMWGVWINKLNHLPCWLIDETLASQKTHLSHAWFRGMSHTYAYIHLRHLRI